MNANPTEQFRDAIRSAGLIPPDMIEPGKFHKFPGEGKRNGNTAAWCKLFPDGLGGIYGDYSTGLSTDWQVKRETPYTPAEHEAFKRQIAEARKQAEAERIAKQAEAATTAAAIWKAATPAATDHPYLMRKGIKASGARLYKDALVVPMRDGGVIYSLQFIGPDGIKKFLSGGRVQCCYFSIGNTNDAAALAICEGFATGASIHEATGYPVAVAFNAGNLLAVAKAMRDKFPALAKRLAEYGISSGNVRIGINTPKGFKREWFDEAFSRYLTLSPATSATAPQTNNDAVLRVADNPPRCGNENLSATPKPAPIKACGVVADKKGETTETNMIEVEI